MLTEQKNASTYLTDATCLSILKSLMELGWMHPEIRVEETVSACKTCRKNEKTKKKGFVGKLWSEDFTISFVEADPMAVRIARIVIGKKMLVFHSGKSHRGPSLYILSGDVRFTEGMSEFPVEDEGACILYSFPDGEDGMEAKVFPRPMFSSRKKIAQAPGLILGDVIKEFDDWLKSNVLAPLNERYWILSRKSSEVMAVVGHYRLYESPEGYADAGPELAALGVQIKPGMMIDLLEEIDKGLISLEELSAVQPGIFEEMQITMEEIKKAAKWYSERWPDTD